MYNNNRTNKEHIFHSNSFLNRVQNFIWSNALAVSNSVQYNLCITTSNNFEKVVINVIALKFSEFVVPDILGIGIMVPKFIAFGQYPGSNMAENKIGKLGISDMLLVFSNQFQ